MFIKTSIHNHRPYMVPFPVVRNVNKHNDAILNHNCINLTGVNTVLRYSFVATSHYSSVASICLKYSLMQFISTGAVGRFKKIVYPSKK